MTHWTQIKPYGPKDDTTYWINGIYKIVSYGHNKYHAYIFSDGDMNWGNHFEKPPTYFPANGTYPSCYGYASLEGAQMACERHMLTGYTPTPKTVARANAVMNSLMVKAV